jgi:hypothetical protein
MSEILDAIEIMNKKYADLEMDFRLFKVMTYQFLQSRGITKDEFISYLHELNDQALTDIKDKKLSENVRQIGELADSLKEH